MRRAGVVAILMFAGMLLVAPASSAAPSGPQFTLLGRYSAGSSPWFANEPGTGLGGQIDHSSPVITQLTPAGPQVAVTTGRDGCVHVFRYNAGGASVDNRLVDLPGFPVCIGAIINSSAAIADLDSDGNKEIIFGAGKLYQPGEYGEGQKTNGGVWALRADGANFWGSYHYERWEGVFGTPAIGDIDGDQSPDIVVGGWDMFVHAINANGSQKWAVYNADTIWSSPALTKNPYDPSKLAIVIGTDLGGGNPGGWLGCPQYWNEPGDGTYLVRGLLLALDQNGSMLPNFPKCMDTPIWSTPALTDLNNDGRIDAVFSTNNYSEGGSNIGRAWRVYAIDLWAGGQTMTKLPGWPVVLQGTSSKSMSSPAIGDMNGDGVKEVVMASLHTCTGTPWGCGIVSLYGANGALHWTRGGEFGIYAFMGSPVIGDVNGDGQPEAIIGGGDGYIYAWNYAGNYAAWVQPGGWFFRNSVAVGDMTGDGKLDLVAGGATGSSNPKTRAWLFTMPNPSTVAPWPHYKRDELRQSNNFDPPGLKNIPNVSNMAVAAGNTKANVSWSNPGSGAVSGIKLVRKTGGCPANPGDGTELQDSMATGFNDTGLANATTYYYAAYAHNVTNDFATGVCVSGTPAPPPSAPTGLTSRAEDEQVNLFWTNPVGNNFTGVRVVRKPGAVAPANPTDGTVIYDGAGTTYTDVGRTNGSQYSYSLFAHNGIPEYSGATSGTNSPATHTGPSYSIYFAEGYTGSSGFNAVEYLTLGNVEVTDSVVTVTYFFDTGAPVEKTYAVPKNKRVTVNVDGDVGNGKSVGVRVSTRSGPGVVAERPMYFNGNPGGINVEGGHAGVSMPKPRNAWYFAEGYTGPGFVEYVSLLNPSGEAPSTVVSTYVFASGAPKIVTDVIPPMGKVTKNVGTDIGPPGRDVSVSVAVVGGPPVAAERVVYFAADPALGQFTSGGHVHAGAPAPAPVWFFAEGYTGSGFVEYLTIQNPNPTPSELTATYVFNGGGAPKSVAYNVAANSRKTIRVNDVVGPGKELSVRLETGPGSPPVVAERPMYFRADPALGAVVAGGHDVVGANAPGNTFYFAEGYTGSGFVEFLTIQNPGLTDTTVYFDYVFNTGGGTSSDLLVPASSRRTVNVNAMAGSGKEVSVKVTSPQPVIVERPMYFYANPGLGSVVTGGHDVVGYQPA